MAADTPSWPPPTGVTTPRVPSSSTILVLTGSTTINAPASFIFDIILDTSTYPQWSSFIPKVTIDSQPQPQPDASSINDQPEASSSSSASSNSDCILKRGTRFTFHANMSPTSTTNPKLFPTHLRVTDLSTPSNSSSYIPTATLSAEPTYTADLSTVYRVAWADDKRHAWEVGPTVERFTEVIVRGEHECEVRTWECQGGAVAHVVKWMYKGVLERKFSQWGEELRVFGQAMWLKECMAELHGR